MKFAQRSMLLWGAALLAATTGLCQEDPDPEEPVEPSEPAEPAEPAEPIVLPEEFDYIVVGGGTAGLTVADRLTESGEFTVLVMEYGDFDDSSSVQTVTRGARAFQNQTHLFTFSSLPQPNLNGRETTVVVGKLLGGSSAVNGFQVQRGSKGNYDMWSWFWEDGSWGWDYVLPLFKKAWRFVPPSIANMRDLGVSFDTGYWGTRGDVIASFPSMNYPILRVMFDAFREMPNINFPSDSGAGETGVFWYPHSADPSDYTRSHSRTGHWDEKEAERENYYTMTGVKVLEVLFDDDMVATGVTFVPAGTEEITENNLMTIGVRNEVILAAGTIHTPQILQCSGIGGAELLEEGGINVKVDLPGVGMNFQDHPYNVGAKWVWNNLTDDLHPVVDDLDTDEDFRAAARDEFEANKTGPLTIASGNLGAFLPLSVIAPEAVKVIAARLDSQDFGEYLPTTDWSVRAGYEAQKKLMAQYFRDGSIATYNLFMRGGANEGSVVHLTPVSRGTVLIDTADPWLSEPKVDYCALCNPVDMDIMVEFTRYTREYFALDVFADLEPEETAPGADVTDVEDIKDWIRENVSPSTFHPVGTAAMMPRELGGVVDKELKVYGSMGLRVVDASVMPLIPGAYTQQTTYAVAEGAAGLIMADAAPAEEAAEEEEAAEKEESVEEEEEAPVDEEEAPLEEE